MTPPPPPLPPVFLASQRQLFFQRRRRTRIRLRTRSFAQILFGVALILFCSEDREGNNNILELSQWCCSSRCGSSESNGRNVIFVSAWETCVAKQNDDRSVDVCPNGNTCCKIFAGLFGPENDGITTTTTSTQLPFLQSSPSQSSSYGCVPSDMGRYNATCCHMEDDDGAGDGHTGCPVGYTCEWLSSKSFSTTTIHGDDRFQMAKFDNDNRIGNDRIPVCIAPENHQDPLTIVLPRYHLCQIPSSADKFDVRTVHGLPITTTTTTTTTTAANQRTATAKLAYYSSHGPIEEINVSTGEATINKVLIFVHGANRNGDDYFCSGLSTVHLYQRQQKRPRHSQDVTKDNVLVIAPIFYGNTDRDKIPSDKSFLYWNVSGDSDGPWRYGADAMGPVPHISSFDALDALIMALRSYIFQDNQSKQKRLASQSQKERNMITIAGHSSGGQMIQRWTLLTSSKIWPSSRVDPTRNYQIRAVVANPSSYVYLSPLRLIDGQWKEPSASTQNQCPMYNQWEWGLDDGGTYDVPYKRKALHPNGNNTITSQRRIGNSISNESSILTDVIDRYKYHREVVYLIGEHDRCNVSSSLSLSASASASASASSFHSHNEWCNSHQLETTCMDEIQGTNRFERNHRYMMSLSAEVDDKKGKHHRHRRMIVPNVGHDHTMMFQSRQGLEALYADDDDDDGSDKHLNDEEGGFEDNAATS